MEKIDADRLTLQAIAVHALIDAHMLICRAAGCLVQMNSTDKAENVRRIKGLIERALKDIEDGA